MLDDLKDEDGDDDKPKYQALSLDNIINNDGGNKK